MKRLIPPHFFLVVILAGWLNRKQQEILDYLIEENRVLKRQLKGRRLRLTDDERRRLARKGKALGRKLVSQVAKIVTPDTLLRWHRRGGNSGKFPSPHARGVLLRVRAK